MLLTTSSAGSFIHNALLTKFTVTGGYQVHPGALKKNASTQQSTWMVLEDGGGKALALEDGGTAAGLGGGIGRRFKIAAAALGSGGGRRTCNNGVGISVIKAGGLFLRCQHQRWQEPRERMRPMQGTYIDGNGKEIGISWWQWWWCGCKDGAGKARARG
jgi:hypothetical protein